MKIILENNIGSTKYKYCLVLCGDGTIDNPRWCIANFSNKKPAVKILNFLNWHQKRFGEFATIEDCATRLANACSQAKINYMPGV